MPKGVLRARDEVAVLPRGAARLPLAELRTPAARALVRAFADAVACGRLRELNSPCCPTLLAAANDGHVRRVDFEAADPEHGREGCRFGVVNLPVPTARRAIPMTVLRGDPDVELLATIRTVTVAHQAELLKHVESAVHRRGHDLSVVSPAAFDELGTRQVTGGACQLTHDDAALRSPAQPALPKLLFHRSPRLGE